MKQTATDYFYDRVLKLFMQYHDEDVPTIDFSEVITEAHEQAKEMEKQQIRDAYFMGWKTREHKPINTEARHEDYSNYYLRDIYGL